MAVQIDKINKNNDLPFLWVTEKPTLLRGGAVAPPGTIVLSMGEPYVSKNDAINGNVISIFGRQSSAFGSEQIAKEIKQIRLNANPRRDHLEALELIKTVIEKADELRINYLSRGYSSEKAAQASVQYFNPLIEQVHQKRVFYEWGAQALICAGETCQKALSVIARTFLKRQVRDRDGWSNQGPH